MANNYQVSLEELTLMNFNILETYKNTGIHTEGQAQYIRDSMPENEPTVFIMDLNIGAIKEYELIDLGEYLENQVRYAETHVFLPFNLGGVANV